MHTPVGPIRFWRSFLPNLASLALIAFFALPVALKAQFTTSANTDGVSCTITGYTGSGGAVTIPSTINGLTVTSIGSGAFYDCSGLTSVTIPSSVTFIGMSAFEDCTSLTSVTIPSSVTTIWAFAFQGCTGLTSVTIPSSVTSIGNAVFVGCSGLTGISVSDANTAFSSVNGVLFDASQATIVCFPAGNAVTSYAIPSSVTSIGDDAFEGCARLTSVTIPSSVTSIGSGAFEACARLTSVTIPSSVTSVGVDAFNGCSGLNSVTIPSSVTSIGAGAFGGCGGLNSVTIPSSVTSIGMSAFENCTGLTSVTIPSSVAGIGDFAFYDCTSLTSVTIPSGVTSIGQQAFAACSGLTSVTIPSSATSIGDGAFSGCRGLTSVTIPFGVTSIGDDAFSGCNGLTSVTIPSSVTSIGVDAFGACRGLTGISVLAGNSAFSSVNGVLFDASQATIVCFPTGSPVTSYAIPSSVTSIGAGSFLDCTGLTSVTIPSSVTSIGKWAFEDCSGLTSVTIPPSVTSIGYGVFYGCNGLTSVTIPPTVTSIGYGAFVGCNDLTSVTIPSSVTSIGDSAFYGCSGLKAVYCLGNVPTADSTAFSGDSNLTAVYYTAGATGWGTTYCGIPTVERAVPVIEWFTPALITSGTALSSAQLNAEANVSGTFVYSPASGTVLPAGTQTLSMTFTPTDGTDYASATVSQTITVVPADYEAFLGSLYRSVLGRQIDSGALAAFSAAMGSGTTRAQIYADLIGSQEYGLWQVEPVIRLYFAAFNRTPDYAGLQNWSNALHAGALSLAQAGDQFASSTEFLQDYGSLDNTAYVQRLYLNVLGRQADPAGLSNWVGELNSGTSRGTVLIGFSESPEFQSDMANKVETIRLYYLLLQRMPTAVERQDWIAFRNGDGQTDTLFALAYPSSLSDSAYVQTIFQGFLCRAADVGALSTFTTGLAAGTVTHGSLVDTVQNSAEFSAYVGPVSRLYLAAFNRIPDQPGLINWVGYAQANSLQSAADTLTASQEFINHYGSSSDTAYVTALYQNVLGRAPDPAGLANWTGLLANGTSRGGVLIGLSQSTEGINLFAPTLRTFLSYYAFLNTAPAPSDLTYWNNYLTTLDDQMRETLLADMTITKGS